eukprot:1908289-Amphidinium_carterae.1
MEVSVDYNDMNTRTDAICSPAASNCQPLKIDKENVKVMHNMASHILASRQSVAALQPREDSKGEALVSELDCYVLAGPPINVHQLTGCPGMLFITRPSLADDPHPPNTKLTRKGSIGVIMRP